MKRPEVVSASENGTFPDASFAKAHPTLSEYMSEDRWDDGKPRERSTVQLKLQDGAILATLQDHDLQRGLYVVGASVAEALKSLEKHAASPTADWRMWKRGKSKGK